MCYINIYFIIGYFVLQHLNLVNSKTLQKGINLHELTPEEKMEMFNKTYEKLKRLVNIIGQLDNYIEDRARTIFKKLAIMTDELPHKKHKIRQKLFDFLP